MAPPRLRAGVRLKYDGARSRWMLLAPERGYVLNESALAIVRRIDGRSSIDEIGAALGHADDVGAFVGALAQARLVDR
ncbi:MAG: pyrroloquinoline quinone biosynthesis peptide chaperone PqqD [Myxococcales bacterium]|nr:pyrroloquinoline quinone biosynthesis peptide chaperone PqqD [Myxococcales bacterium]